MSIIVERILSGAPYQSNCYVLRAGERSQQAVAIDPGGDPADVLAVLGEATLAGILVTHGDVDHIAGVAELARTTRAAVWMPAGEAGALRTGTTRGGLRVSPHLPEHELRGGESLSVGGMVFDVLSVPGHSSHHLAYLVEESIFSGDLIFTGSIGRIDLPGGDFPTLLASVVGLLERAGPQAVLYPGHGDPTTLARELETNPFLAALRGGLMAERFQAPRGTRDILPSEQPIWFDTILASMEELAVRYGYGRIQTPGFEDSALFTRTAGAASDVVQKEMYTFTDRSDRSLTLRPEGTAPICRAYVEHGMHREPQPVKLYTFAPMYRYAAPQKGRFREHWQWSVEAIGSADPAIDAELIQLYAGLLARLGVHRVELRLNSIGDAVCRPAYVEALEAWLDSHDALLDEEARLKRRTSPLQVFDVKNQVLQEALAGAPRIGEALCGPCREHLETLAGYLDALSVPYTLDPALVRGLDYYTRTTFEFVHTELGLTICGGGRYDGLVEQIGGPPTPGIGFGAGIDRLKLAAESEGLTAQRAGLDVFIVLDGAAKPAIVALLAELRAAGLACDIDYAGRSLKGQATQATRSGARAVIFAHAEAATVRRAGQPDELVPLAELGARLRP